MVDYHVHSTVSFDGHSTMEEYIAAARQKGISELCFTEHHEMDYPYEDVHPHLDFDVYDKAFSKASAHSDGIVLKKGLEVGLIPDSIERICADLLLREFDFIIASQHLARGKDPWYGNFFEGISVRQGQKIYLEEMLECLRQYTNYSVIGHIGYIDKYLHSAQQEDETARPFTFNDFPELLDAILSEAIKHGKGIELNTSNYYIHGYPTPHPSIIKRFFELGGEVVTFGSDAHSADALGGYMQEAMALLRECGGKWYCTFDKMQPSFHTL